MKLRELLKGVDVLEMHADADMDIGDVSYDSRQTKPGDLFVAVVGYESDGHGYIDSAAKMGAAAVLCQRAPECDVPYVLTADSRRGLAVVSRNYFGDPAAGMKLIGVTGTNGKTTTTVLVKHMLEDVLGAKVGLVGTIENMIGGEALHTERTTPESYELWKLFRQMADAGCTHVVMEVSSHSLVLDRVEGMHFAAAVFTNLTQDHLDFHKTMEAYAEAKALLFGRSDAGAVNIDDPHGLFMKQRAACPVMTYSARDDSADLVARDIRHSAAGVKFVAMHDGALERVTLGIPGAFSVYNALSVISCGLMLGLRLHDIAASLARAKGVKGRVEVIPTGGDYTILADYAHTPDALENVLTAMREVANGRIVAVFGCGGDRDRTKRPIMGEIAARCADFVIVTSDNPRTEDPQAIVDEIAVGLKGTKTPHVIIVDRIAAIAYAIDNHRPGDVIVLAGKGHETYQEVNHVKHHMDEREIVAEHLRKRENS